MKKTKLIIVSLLSILFMSCLTEKKAEAIALEYLTEKYEEEFVIEYVNMNRNEAKWGPASVYFYPAENPDCSAVVNIPFKYPEEGISYDSYLEKLWEDQITKDLIQLFRDYPEIKPDFEFLYINKGELVSNTIDFPIVKDYREIIPTLPHVSLYIKMEWDIPPDDVTIQDLEFIRDTLKKIFHLGIERMDVIIDFYNQGDYWDTLGFFMDLNAPNPEGKELYRLLQEETLRTGEQIPQYEKAMGFYQEGDLEKAEQAFKEIFQANYSPNRTTRTNDISQSAFSLGSAYHLGLIYDKWNENSESEYWFDLLDNNLEYYSDWFFLYYYEKIPKQYVINIRGMD